MCMIYSHLLFLSSKTTPPYMHTYAPSTMRSLPDV
jgi:hypothetical protein